MPDALELSLGLAGEAGNGQAVRLSAPQPRRPAAAIRGRHKIWDAVWGPPRRRCDAMGDEFHCRLRLRGAAFADRRRLHTTRSRRTRKRPSNGAGRPGQYKIVKTRHRRTGRPGSPRAFVTRRSTQHTSPPQLLRVQLIYGRPALDLGARRRPGFESGAIRKPIWALLRRCCR